MLGDFQVNKLEHAGIVWSKTVPSQIKQMQQSLPILVIGCDSKGANAFVCDFATYFWIEGVPDSHYCRFQPKSLVPNEYIVHILKISPEQSLHYRLQSRDQSSSHTQRVYVNNA